MVDAPFAVEMQTVQVGGETWTLKTLADRQQFHDPDGHHEAAGVQPAYWSLFGVTWDAGMHMAEYMTTLDVGSKRILEIGCGLGLASMVLHRRGADVTASDIHPLAAEFLAENLALNGLAPMPFRVMDWRRPPPDLPVFDLVFASDVLYESDMALTLASFADAFCEREFILTDPGRQLVGRFSRRMEDAGFSATSTATGKARLVRYSRSTRDQ